MAYSITCNTLSSLRPCPAIWSSALKWMSSLEIGQALHVSDVQVDNKLTILTDGEQIVAAVAAPKVVEEEVEAEDTASEPEVITEKTEG